MSDLKVTCNRCNKEMQHVCEVKVQDAVDALLRWVPEYVEPKVGAAMQKSSYPWEPSDRERPFFGSQSWSYSIFDKQDARTFHTLIHNLVRQLGFDPSALEDKICAELNAEREEQEARRKAAEERAATRRRAKGERDG